MSLFNFKLISGILADASIATKYWSLQAPEDLNTDQSCYNNRYTILSSCNGQCRIMGGNHSNSLRAMNSSKHSGENIWFCCNNHEEVNGTCIECLDGFQSLDGRPCRPCRPRGFFGKYCFRKCSCITNEKCDQAKGCLKVIPRTEAITKHYHVEGTSSSSVEPSTEIRSKTGTSTVLETTTERKNKPDGMKKYQSTPTECNESANKSQLGETDENGEEGDGVLPRSV
ncbi:unnamed protein product [Mytilus coruscus]|uniref:MEGF10_11 n=1 Tax=Mytilus coruscus TaxID=42192 RepID=A0A6J8EN10_MYTCO|nr:unnamed protein product [Mytilus coruscus]